MEIVGIFLFLFAVLGLAVGADHYDWFSWFSQRGMTSAEIWLVIAICTVVLVWILWQVRFKPLPSYGASPRKQEKKDTPTKDTVFLFRIQKMMKEVTIL